MPAYILVEILVQSLSEYTVQLCSNCPLNLAKMYMRLWSIFIEKYTPDVLPASMRNPHIRLHTFTKNEKV